MTSLLLSAVLPLKVCFVQGCWKGIVGNQTSGSQCAYPVCLVLLYCYHFKNSEISVKANSCTQPGPGKAVKQECRQLHCCVREFSLYPLFTSANLQEQMSLLHTIWSGPLFLFFLNHLIIIHFGKASDVCSASIPSNYLHSNKSTQHCLTKPRDFLPSVANFLLWTYAALKSHRETIVCCPD